jgi:hypothetical protein
MGVVRGDIGAGVGIGASAVEGDVVLSVFFVAVFLEGIFFPEVRQGFETTWIGPE